MSPRIPVYETRVESSGIPSAPAPRLRTPDYSSANAVRQAIGGQGGLGDTLSDLPKMGMATAGGELSRLRAQQAAAAEAAKEASALAEAGSTVEFNRRIQARLNGDSAAGSEGFLTLKGLQASEQSAKVLADMEKDRQDVAEATADLDARQRFLLRSSEALLAYRKQVETHVDKEFGEAKAATLKALEGQALSMAESGVADPDTYGTITRQVESLLKENVPGEVGTAAVKEFRSKSAAALITGKLAAGDVDGATQLSHVLQPELGGRFVEVKREVDRANVGRKKDLANAAITKQVEEWALQARNKDSYVTENDLRAKAGAVGGRGIQVPEDQRDEYEAAIAKKVKEENARLKNDIAEHQKAAERADLEDAPIPGASVEFLTEYDPHFLRGLRDARRARERSERVERDGTASQRAEERRRQAEINSEAEEKYAARLKENPNLSHKDFINEFTREVSAREGYPVTVTPRFAAKLENDGATARQKQGTTELRAEDTFSTNVEKAVDGLTIQKKGGKPDEVITRNWGGYAALRYRRALEANGGKPLSAEQADELSAAIVREALSESGSTGKVTKAPALAPAYNAQRPKQGATVPSAPKKTRPTATGANGQKFQLSEDGKTWEPIK